MVVPLAGEGVGAAAEQGGDLIPPGQGPVPVAAGHVGVLLGFQGGQLGGVFALGLLQLLIDLGLAVRQQFGLGGVLALGGGDLAEQGLGLGALILQLGLARFQILLHLGLGGPSGGQVVPGRP